MSGTVCRALLAETLTPGPLGPLADRLDVFYGDLAEPAVWAAARPILGTMAPSDLLADLQYAAQADAGDEPHIPHSEYEWSSAEANRWDRWVRACDQAGARSEAEWRAAMAKLLRVLLPMLKGDVLSVAA